MKTSISLLVLAFLLISGWAQYPFSYKVDDSFSFKWRFPTSDMIEFEVTYQATALPSWFALGFAKGASGHSNGDMILFTYNSQQEYYFRDSFSTTMQCPKDDTTLGGTFDIINGTYEITGNTVVARFGRKLDTGDSYDVAIVDGSNHIIYAYGTDAGSHDNRGVVSVDFVPPSPSDYPYSQVVDEKLTLKWRFPDADTIEWQMEYLSRGWVSIGFGNSIEGRQAHTNADMWVANIVDGQGNKNCKILPA